jgi:hypothetical protein
LTKNGPHGIKVTMPLKNADLRRFILSRKGGDRRQD